MGRLNNDIETLKKEKKQMTSKDILQQELYDNLHAKYTNLQETLKTFEKHIDNREGDITAKEKDILTLKSQNRTLENFRYVLDHRINQLTEDKGPILGIRLYLYMSLSTIKSQFLSLSLVYSIRTCGCIRETSQ